MGSSTVRVILSAALVASLGCTKSTPGFDVFDANLIPQPLFDGKTQKTMILTSDSVSTAVHGECDFKISSIQVQVIGVGAAATTLAAVTDVQPVVNCQGDGTFALSLKSLTGLGFTAVENKTYEIQFRGRTTAGLSKPSSLFLVYGSPDRNGPKRMVITSGGTESSAGPRLATSLAPGTHFKAVLRVDHRMINYASPSVQDAMTVQSSPHFKAKIGAAASAN